MIYLFYSQYRLTKWLKNLMLYCEKKKMTFFLLALMFGEIDDENQAFFISSSCLPKIKKQYQHANIYFNILLTFENKSETLVYKVVRGPKKFVQDFSNWKLFKDCIRFLMENVVKKESELLLNWEHGKCWVSGFLVTGSSKIPLKILQVAE